MSTQLFFRAEVRTTPTFFSTGNNDAPIGTGPWGATIGWNNYWLDTSRGSGNNNAQRASVASNTTGIEFPGTTGEIVPAAYISAPLDQDVTIAGTITFNLWMGENTTSVNAGAMCVIERITSTGAIGATVASSAKGTELPKISSIAAQNWTVDATDTAFLKGDRIRIRVLMKNVGTMGTDATGCQFSCSGTTAAAQGDSYVTFTETFGFLTTDPTFDTTYPVAGADYFVGNVTGNTRQGQKFSPTLTTTAIQLEMQLRASGSPSDNLNIGIQADSSGSPSGTDLVSTSIAGSLLSTSYLPTTFPLTVSLTGGTSYWVVAERSGAIDAVNYYRLRQSGVRTGAHVEKTYSGAAWSADTGVDVAQQVFASNVLFPVTTVSDVATAALDELAWTARGLGVTTYTLATATGWTAPLQWKDTFFSGTVLDWWTKQLTTFTLSAPVLVNARSRENDAGINGAVRCEVAVTAGDGSSPVVWGATSHPTELTTSEAAYQFYVAGDDVTVTDGQRLRIRFYLDDYQAAAMAATGAASADLFVAGTSGGASGDTYLIFGQTLTEYVAPVTLPYLVMAPKVPV